MNAQTHHSRLSLGRIIPLVIALSALLDVGTRFLPLAWFSLRLEEPSQRYAIGLGGITPNFHYDMPRAYGDLANMTDWPHVRFYRREWQMADANGFRLDGARTLPGQPPETLLFGDSFATGVALSDDATLAAQFSRLPGRSMLNPAVRPDWGRIRRVIDFLGMKRGTVVLALVDRLPLPGAEDFQERPESTSPWHHISRLREKLWDGFWEVSPLKIFSERLLQRIQNNRYLPNPQTPMAQIATLPDGRPIHFYKLDIDNYGQQPDGNVAGIVLLQSHLREHGLKLLVLMIPDKYAVYRQLVKNPPPAFQGPSRISGYEHALRQAGIPVFSLEQLFLQEAAASLQRGELLYWPDDTHWNPEGTRLAAKALDQALR